MPKDAWVGIDLGTSSLKVLALGEGGALLDEREIALPLGHPRQDWTEADPPAWTRAVDASLEPLAAAYDVRGIGITGQMHGAVLLDEWDHPVRPAVLWPDQRSRGQRQHWDALPPRLRGRLGSPWSPGMTGPVLAWLCEHEPDLVGRADRVVLPKDYVRGHLVAGSHVTDPSDASGTLLWDVSLGTWVEGVQTLVPVRLLPSVSPSGSVVGTWRDAAVYVGGGDTPVSLLALEHAIGGWQPGDVVVNLGTGAQVIDPLATPPVGDGWPVVHTYADAVGGHYAMVAAQNAGLALSWAQERLGLSWERLVALARSSPPGAGGALFSPFVVDERGPLAAAESVGWTDDATEAQSARSALEAQAFLLRRSWELLDPLGTRVFLTGGGARDGTVRQLVADVLGRAVHYVPVRSASALGAVLLAGGGPLEHLDRDPTPAEPTPSPALEEAYVHWRSHCYGIDAG